MCSSNVSDTANMLRNKRKSNPTAVPLFRSGHMSAICVRPSQKEVGVKRVETLVSTLLPLAVGTAPPAAGRGTLPPQRRRIPR